MRFGLTVALFACLAVPAIAGQQQSTTATRKAWTPPRTAWGDPDLQGIWPSTDMVGVPFERPAELAGRNEVSDKEFAEREEQAKRRDAADREEFVSETAPRRGDGTGPPSHWLEWGKPSRQASLVVTPADGKLPPMTDEGQKRAGSLRTPTSCSAALPTTTTLGRTIAASRAACSVRRFPSSITTATRFFRCPATS